MTSLQTTLLILAVSFIVVVLAYNFVQSRNASKRVARSREGMAEAMSDSVAQGKHAEGPISLGAGFGETNSKVQQGPVLERFNLPSLDPTDRSDSSQTNGDSGSSQSNAIQNSLEQKGSDSGGTTSDPLLRVGVTKPAVISNKDELTNKTHFSFSAATPAADSKSAMNNFASSPSHPSGSPTGDAWLLRSFGLHPKADCIVQWQLPEAMSGEKLLSIASGLRRVGSKPVMFEGQNAQLDLSEVWEPLIAGERFAALRMGVLMANRHGALNAMEFSDFAAFAEKLAAHFQVHIEVPDMQPTLQRARALDTQCAELDAQVALNVIAADSLTVEDLASIAIELGLSERGNNRYAMLTEHGEVLYSLALGDAPNRLTLLLDVPRSPSAATPWPRMVDTAQRCAARFAGRLVDDFDKPLNKDAIERIGIQITQRYQSLSDASLDAGSPVALRLFN